MSDTKADHAAALAIARIDVTEWDKESTPYLLAAAYLELRKLVKVYFDESEWDGVDMDEKALRAALGEDHG